MKKLSLTLVLVIVLALAAPVLAHESRTTDGGIQIVFGWSDEPAIAGEPNGPEVMLSLPGEHTEATEEADGEHQEGAGGHHGEGSTPVTDAELQVEVSFGDQTITLALRPAFNQPGRYYADLMPMLPGDYTFRVFGTAGGVEVNEVFTSADGKFSSVEPATDIQFPLAAPSTLELMMMIEELQAQLDELRAAIGQ